MGEYRVEAVLTEDRTLVIKDLPFNAGDTVEVIVVPHRKQAPAESRYPLHGTPVHLERPTEPAAEEDWEAIK